MTVTVGDVVESIEHTVFDEDTGRLDVNQLEHDYCEKDAFILTWYKEPLGD